MNASKVTQDVAPISVIITTYNQPKMLKEAIESVFNQTAQPAEIVIVDDASTDETPQVIRRFAQRDNRLKYFRLPQNRGMQFTAQFGLSKSNSHYVAYLNHDDVWFPEHLELCLNALKEDEKVVMAFGGYGLMDSAGHVLIGEVPEVELSEHPLECLLLKDVIVQLPRAVFERQAVIEAGGISHWVGDWVLNCLLALKHPRGIVRVPRTTMYFRSHSAQSFNRPGELRDALLAATEFIFAKLPEQWQARKPQVIATNLLHSAFAFSVVGNTGEAARCVIRAIKSDPSAVTRPAFRTALIRLAIPAPISASIRTLKRRRQLRRSRHMKYQTGFTSRGKC